MRGHHALKFVLFVPIVLGATGCEQHALREEISLLRQENERLRDHIAGQETAAGSSSGTGGAAMSEIDMGSQASTGDVLATPETNSPPIASAPAQTVNYVVRSGDSLSRIARNVYGDTSKWLLIYNANRRVIGPNYDKLEVGMELEMPAVRN